MGLTSALSGHGAWGERKGEASRRFIAANLAKLSEWIDTVGGTYVRLDGEDGACQLEPFGNN